MTVPPPSGHIATGPMATGPGATGHIAIFAYPEFGHVKPLVATVRRLVARGHRVTWITGDRYAEVVRETGAELLGYPSARPPFSAGATATAADLGNLGLLTMRESIDVVIPAVEAGLADVPDLVLFDIESVVAARTLAKRWNRPVVQVFPCIASNEAYSLHAQVFTPDDAVVQSIFELLHGFLAATSQDASEIWTYLTPFADRNLVLLPRELQPQGESFDERYVFAGHGVEAGEGELKPWSPPPTATSVALVSLGTETDNADFFRSCLEAFGHGHRHVVMTLGRGSAGLDPGEHPPANVETHAWLPHPAVLPHADVFVTHGGMGSIIEALYFGVPMVVVPHHPENALNGERLAELGLARVLPEAGLTAEALQAAVDEVSDDAAMRASAARMSECVRAAGGAEAAVAAIEGYLAADRAADRAAATA